MDRPFGRYDGLLVVQPYDTVFLRLTHEVTHGITLWNVEIEISLDTTVMSVCGHSVPDTSGLELSETHLQLAWALLEDIIDNELVDHTVIALLHLSGCKTVGFDRTLASVDGNELCFLSCVSSCGVEIEFGGICSILTAECDLLVTTAYVKCILEVGFVILTVDIDDAVTTYINNTKLTTLEEILRLERFDGLKLYNLGHGDHAAIDETVIEGVSEIDLILLHDFRHHEVRAELVGVIVLYVVRMTGAKYGIVCLSHS